MQADHTIGCFGKCTSGLKRKELDQFTDNIDQTLAHPRVREIFKQYLDFYKFTDSLDCLNVYEYCTDVIEKHENVSASNLNLDVLKQDVENVNEMAENLDGVPQLDSDFFKRYDEVINSNCRIAMFEILDDTRNRLKEFLERVHRGFKQYISEPCPSSR